MNSEGSSYIRVWLIVAFVVTTLIVSTAFVSYHGDERVEKMVLAGADPIAARCAIGGFSQSNELICAGAGKQFVMNLK